MTACTTEYSFLDRYINWWCEHISYPNNQVTSSRPHIVCCVILSFFLIASLTWSVLRCGGISTSIQLYEQRSMANGEVSDWETVDSVNYAVVVRQLAMSTKVISTDLRQCQTLPTTAYRNLFNTELKLLSTAFYTFFELNFSKPCFYL